MPVRTIAPKLVPVGVVQPIRVSRSIAMQPLVQIHIAIQPNLLPRNVNATAMLFSMALHVFLVWLMAIVARRLMLSIRHALTSIVRHCTGIAIAIQLQIPAVVTKAHKIIFVQFGTVLPACSQSVGVHQTLRARLRTVVAMTIAEIFVDPKKMGLALGMKPAIMPMERQAPVVKLSFSLVPLEITFPY